MKLTGKVVLVTGANRGIGAALVNALVARDVAKVYAGAATPHRSLMRSDVTASGSSPSSWT